MRHPVHPALVHFPIACWTLAVAADVASFWLSSLVWQGASVLMAMGCAIAVVAMLAGILDLARVPEGAAMRVAYWHMGVMLLASSLFSGRLLYRLDGMQPLAPDALSLVLDAGGFGCLVIGGWLGGKLVYHYGVGVQKE